MPVDLATLSLFVVAATLLVLTPGPDMIYVLTRGIGQGRVAGLISVLGIVSGSLVHASAVALGLASLFAASPLAYDILRYAGAAYLLWLAYKAFASGSDEFVLAARAPAGRRRIFVEALVTNLRRPDRRLARGAPGGTAHPALGAGHGLRRAGAPPRLAREALACATAAAAPAPARGAPAPGAAAQARA